MSNFKTIHCPVCDFRLFDTNSEIGIIEIKCKQCRNVINIPLYNTSLAKLKKNRNVTSK